MSSGQQDHERKMEIIQQMIDDAHRRILQQADDALKNVADNYQNKLLEKIAEELKLAKEAIEHDEDRIAEQHRIRAEVYKSALDAIRR